MSVVHFNQEAALEIKYYLVILFVMSEHSCSFFKSSNEAIKGISQKSAVIKTPSQMFFSSVYFTKFLKCTIYAKFGFTCTVN